MFSIYFCMYTFLYIYFYIYIYIYIYININHLAGQMQGARATLGAQVGFCAAVEQEPRYLERSRAAVCKKTYTK